MTVSERKSEGWIDDVVGALCDPIIVMPGGWGDTLPDWIKPAITTERLIENVVAMKENREVVATDAEACAYLYTASLTAPMPRGWTQIYLYIAGRVMERKAGKGSLPEDIRVETLTESQQRELKQLKAWIYQRRVKHRKERARTARREEKQAKEASPAEELETKPAQSAFF